MKEIVLAAIAVVFLLGSADPPASPTPSPYERAWTLYAEGLSRQLALDPRHEKATYLLAVTYFGTDQMPLALEQFDQAIKLASDHGTIVPKIVFYRARTLFELGRCTEAKQVLESHWAFWQGDDDLEKKYESFYPAVVAHCPKEADRETPYK